MAIIYLFRQLPGGIHLPTLFPVPALQPVPGRAALEGTICGISACKVYPRLVLPPKAVGSYPTFSSLPAVFAAKAGPAINTASAVIFCGTVS